MPVHIIVKNTRTMDMTIDQQVALDEALVPYASRSRIGKSNFYLISDISSKESTLQLVGEIRRLNNVNINKLHQPWRSFAAIINKCLSGKSTGYDSLRFTKVFIHYFMSKDPSILRRNKVNWHYVRDDQMFTTIKLVLRHQNTQQFGAMLPIKLTNKDIRNSEAYKEYYVVATEAAPPKTKSSVRKTKSSSDTIVTPPTTAAGTRLSTSAKGKQPAKASKAKSLTMLSEKLSDEEDDDDVDEGSDDQNDDDDDQDEGNDDDQDFDEEGEEFIYPKLSIPNEEETKDEESFDPIAKTPKKRMMKDVNINLEGRVVQITDVHTTQEFEDTHVTLTRVNPDGIDSIFETTSQMDVPAPTTVALLTLSAPTLTPSTIATISTVPQAPTPPTTAPSTLLQFARAVSSIHGIVQRYMDQRMNEAVKVAVQIQSDRLCDEAQAENEEFLKNLDENIQKIIKEQVKEQVKVQVSKILPKIEKMVNEQLEAEVLTRSSNSSKTSYAVADDLSKMELKKILIEKMEGNKYIHRSDEQRNLDKALIKAYESDKIILDTYRDVVTLKRRRDDDADKDEEPSTGSDWGPKRRREGKEPESTNTLKEKATKTTSKSTQGSKSRQTSASESAIADEPMQTTHDLEEPSHQEFESGAADGQPIAKASQHPEWFS
uniref:Retrovirus-related Pol polyprotein from transposon TNT 1-94 n=1 Tax=Tanacetum cinerariifolium TaxID=118510 RepID=A0A6L2LTN7_TANCI|nr:hypothetical protein [Tanacetum cinerariifolium]